MGVSTNFYVYYGIKIDWDNAFNDDHMKTNGQIGTILIFCLMGNIIMLTVMVLHLPSSLCPMTKIIKSKSITLMRQGTHDANRKNGNTYQLAWSDYPPS